MPPFLSLSRSLQCSHEQVKVIIVSSQTFLQVGQEGNIAGQVCLDVVAAD